MDGLLASILPTEENIIVNAYKASPCKFNYQAPNRELTHLFFVSLGIFSTFLLLLKNEEDPKD